jgi:hypothetical protein
VLGPLGAATALGIGTLPALAQTAPTTTSTGDCSTIRFELANPGPGSRVELGTDVIQGIALDTHAPSGSTGIDRIDFFLDSRDAGGLSVGTAVPDVTAGPFGPGSFQTTVSLPNMVGGHDLFAYAHDSVTNQESVISVPIALGEDPSKAFTTAPPSATTETCTTGSTPAATTTSATTPTTTPATTATPSTTTTMVSPVASTITFQVGNPSPGDTIHAGGYAIQGVAFDKSAQSGSGIDRIDVFLDNRDSGGVLLGQANFGQNNTWTATVTLPSNQLGLHTLWFYAHSTATGQETAVSVPVTIAP